MTTDVAERDGTEIEGAPRGYKGWFEKLQRANQKSTELAWVVADLVLEGERFGEFQFQAYAELGMSEQAVKRYKQVAASFPEERRVWDLPMRHYMAVQRLDEQGQDEALTASVENGWTSDDLRAHLAEQHPRKSIGSGGKLNVRDAAYNVWAAAVLQEEHDQYVVPRDAMRDLSRALGLSE